jgi:hypothetical protein
METPEQRAQNAKFGYKAPESVYKKHDPKASMVGSGASLRTLSSEKSAPAIWLTHSPYHYIFDVLTIPGKAFTGVSPMDFYLRQSAAKKAEKAKEAETKVGIYQHNMYKGSL